MCDVWHVFLPAIYIFEKIMQFKLSYISLALSQNSTKLHIFAKLGKNG